MLFSCDSEDESSFIVASYKDNDLTLEEVLLNKPYLVDSAMFVKEYIDDWLLNKVILDKAKLYIDENDKELQSKVDAYKENLIIYEYEKDLINNQFDTTVLRSEIKEYYINHQEDYQIEGEETSLSLEFREIRDIIRHEKRLEFLKDIKEKLYSEAESSKHIKQYK